MLSSIKHGITRSGFVGGVFQGCLQLFGLNVNKGYHVRSDVGWCKTHYRDRDFFFGLYDDPPEGRTLN